MNNFYFELTVITVLVASVLLQQSFSTLYILLVSELLWLIFLLRSNILMVSLNNPEMLLYTFTLLSLVSIDLAMGLSFLIVQHNVYNFIDSGELSSLKKKKKVFLYNSSTLVNKFNFS